MSNPYLAKERVIREKRTLEAVRKNMVGASGKLGTIAKWLGHKIVRQGSSDFDQSYLDALCENWGEEEELPMSDAASFEEGYHFDGLSRGKHFEIRYLHSTTELVAYFKGHVVYREIAGDLLAYAPFPEWEEEMVDPLYKEAQKKMKSHAKEMESVKERSMIEMSKYYLNKFRTKWGI